MLTANLMAEQDKDRGLSCPFPHSHLLERQKTHPAGADLQNEIAPLSRCFNLEVRPYVSW